MRETRKWSIVSPKTVSTVYMGEFPTAITNYLKENIEYCSNQLQTQQLLQPETEAVCKREGKETFELYLAKLSSNKVYIKNSAGLFCITCSPFNLK